MSVKRNRSLKETAFNPEDYRQFLVSIKDRVRTAQVRAGLAVNRELVLLYWRIGREILEKQSKLGWGAKVIDRLSVDLRHAFPEMKGFSPRNLKYMRKIAETYPEEEFVRQAVAQIPWSHNCILVDKIKDKNKRVWYIQETIEHGWSRNILVHQIESGLYRRQGKALTNFEFTLPKPQSDLAQQILKDPYNFDFLTLGEHARERDLEKGLLEHFRDFLLELGKGFAFVGSQHPLEVGGRDFFIDLLFYHLSLRCYVAIELKIGDFKPEYAGKMNFYLSAVDDLLRHGDDQPSIGIILCKTRSKIIVEYSLRDTKKPIGVSAYKLTAKLPKKLKSGLPTVEEIEAELEATSRKAFQDGD